ncbi:YqaJ viral recombinase family protein [Candidatus Pacearchaeota archaeon]|nr:YqaJ viral recombinase family protein [Candidatus Pacearchaeota archaeon]
MITINVPQGSEAWFEHRMGRITASKFAVAMSGESTKGFKELIEEIAAEIVSKEIEETYSNTDMERGIELEPYGAKEYENVLGIEVSEVGFCIPDESDPLHEWVGVSPDRLIEGDGILEIKCPKKKTHWGYIKANKLPSVYRWQVQGQLMVTGKDYCDFMSYHPSLKPFIIRVYPDLEMHSQMRERFELIISLVKKEIETYNLYDYHS